jgi:Icc-related predicted phosphoesterase
VAALGDIHVHEGVRAQWSALLADMCGQSDIIVLCGDLTNRGLAREAEVLAESLGICRLPVVAILGNHDVECGQQEEVCRLLTQAGVHMLEDQPREIENVGFAGVKGFCGGFDRNALAPFGEEMVKRFVHESLDEALKLERDLSMLRTLHKIAVLHYAPVRDTVEGEPPEIFPFLGSSRLADPLEHYAVTAAVHGHAHSGTHAGKTPGGIAVYNVALPIMRRMSPQRPYFVLDL